MMKEVDKISKSRYGWTIVAFLMASGAMLAMLGWQLYETRPGAWCALADESTEGLRTACLQTILALLPIKDHTIIGLMTILGISIVALAAVALGVKISAQGPGDTEVSVSRDETRVKMEEVDVVVPSSSEVK